MAEEKKRVKSFTDEQLSAINERKKTLLVSAAAGSGKTATLTERIIRSLTDKENPINIESLLVVTFTNAAAAELRVKLTRALEDAVAEDPENEHLCHQLYMLPSAKIRTIDSFCNDILRSSADRVGLSDGYRIADAAECEFLAISIIDGLIAEIYNANIPEIATPEELEALSDCLTDSKRTEELSEILRYVYEKCESSELGVDALLPLIDFYDTRKFKAVEKTKHGEYLMEITREMLKHYSAIARKYERILSSGSELSLLYSDMAAADKMALERLLKLKSYKSMREGIISFAFSDAPSKRGAVKTSDMLDYADIRKDMREDMATLKGYYAYTEEQWRDNLSGLHTLLSVLYRFEKRFDEIFLSEKKRRSALSYADVERLCYECLIKDGERTDIAINLASQFEAIYIDEYQDVNSLQNSIFSAISRKNNRFMVGDIKQSIYGFRSARPEIFAEMKSKFPPLPAENSDTASVFMSKNFRCDKGIVDFVNDVFDKVFGIIGDKIGYKEGDRLGYAKIHKGPEPEYKAPEICMLDKTKDDGISESYAVAEKISELLKTGRLDNGEPIRPEDIAIIMRGTKGKDGLFAEALASLGIPTRISGAKRFFLSPEVLLTLCLLNVIDNPSRDIYLAGLLCSPLYSFEADDLYLIQHGGDHNTLYEALVSYTEANPCFEKGRRFLNSLDYYRTIAEGIRVDTLISKIYHETGLLSLASRSGGLDNLNLLYDYARSYEAGSYKGLYSFISFINGILDKKTAFDDKREAGEESAVQIITCHSSKGLEYPVVFLVDTGARFTENDVRQRLVFSEDFGVSFRLRTPEGLALVNSPVHDLVCHYVLRCLHEEELRVLYVALTRAREQLYIVGSCPLADGEKYKNKLRLIRENLSPFAIRDMRTYLKIMLVSTGREPLSYKEFIGRDEGENSTDEAKKLDTATHIGEKDGQNGEKEFCFGEGGSFTALEGGALDFGDGGSLDAREVVPDPELVRILSERFRYEYPDKYMTTLPEKLSVSKMSPSVLDASDAEFVFDLSDESFASSPEGDILSQLIEDEPWNSDNFVSIEENSADEKSENKIPCAVAVVGAWADLTEDTEDVGRENLLYECVNNGYASDTADTDINGNSSREGKARTLPSFKTGRASEESAKRGIATHMFLQFCDLRELEKNGAEAELSRLHSLGFLSERDKSRVRLYEIEAFRKSELFSEMMGAKRLYRELRFNLRFPASLFTENEEKRDAYKDKHVLVQGVIDCIVERQDGTLALYDYKTDRLTKEELSSRSLAEKKLRDKHSRQLSYYALAVKEMFSKYPTRVALYSLPMADTVDIEPEIPS